MKEPPTLTFFKQSGNNYWASASRDTTPGSEGGARLWRIFTFMVRVALNRRQEGREEEAGLVEKGETDGG